MVSVILKTKRKYVIVLLLTVFNIIKMFARLLYFACISAEENDSILIFISTDPPSKAL